MSKNTLPVPTDQLSPADRLSFAFPGALEISQAIADREATIEQCREINETPLDVPESVTATARGMAPSWQALLEHDRISSEDLQQHIFGQNVAPSLLADVLEQGSAENEAKKRKGEVVRVLHDDAIETSEETDEEREKRIRQYQQVIRGIEEQDGHKVREVWATTSGPELVEQVAEALRAGADWAEIARDNPNLASRLEEYRYLAGLGYVEAESTEPLPDPEQLRKTKEAKEQAIAQRPFSFRLQQMEAPISVTGETTSDEALSALMDYLGEHFQEAHWLVQVLEHPELSISPGRVLEGLVDEGPRVINELVVAIADKSLSPQELDAAYENFSDWIELIKNRCKALFSQRDLRVEFKKDDSGNITGCEVYRDWSAPTQTKYQSKILNSYSEKKI